MTARARQHDAARVARELAGIPDPQPARVLRARSLPPPTGEQAARVALEVGIDRLFGDDPAIPREWLEERLRERLGL